MKAFVLSRHGSAEKAFELKEMPMPQPKAHELLVEVEAFGLNFADVMARQGLYEDAPPLPSIIGYEVVGRVHSIGAEVKNLKVGDRVAALTRFGGYAQYAVTDARAAVLIPEDLDSGVAAAIATQYSTAYYSAYEMAPIFEGDHVLIQAAAGGVGTALVQMAKNKGAIVYGTAGSEAKLDYLRQLGVDFPINYQKEDFSEFIRQKRGKEGLDIVFDSIGGKSVKKGIKLLGAGGRIVCYGAAVRSGKAKFNDIFMALGFGLYSPIGFLMKSQGLIGVNMLRLADNRPLTLQRCMQNVADMILSGELVPTVGAKYPHSQLAQAHDFLGGRQSMGKVIVFWEK